MNLITQYTAYIAAFCTTIAFVPQVLLIWKTKNTSSVSLGMYSIFTTGVGLWLIYGLMTSQAALIVANAITFLLAFGILVMKLMHTKEESKV